MLQELLPLLPREVGTLAALLAITGTLLGAGLWLVGSRFSRSLITLLLVSLGGWVGLLLPRWCGWSIDGWAPAIGLAVLMGASGFFMHRLWVALGLGLVLAAWAAVAVWILCRGHGVWSLPKYDAGADAAAFAKSLWLSLPDGVRQYLPYACGMALLSGLLSALLWPRVGVVLLYSTGGVSMLVGLGLCTMNFARPQWLGALPAKSSSQLLVVLAMVAFGAVLQWNLAPSKKSKLANDGRPLVIAD